jgi:hypothetical protein
MVYEQCNSAEGPAAQPSSLLGCLDQQASTCAHPEVRGTSKKLGSERQGAMRFAEII